MKILFVGSNNYHNGGFAPFITEQGEILQNGKWKMENGKFISIEVEYFGVKGKGVKGYLKQLPLLKAKIRAFQPDIVHAHYGLCGLLSCLALKSIIPSFHHPIIPPKVVTTYHGSDINDPHVLPLSRISMRLSDWNIFISQKTMGIALGDGAMIGDGRRLGRIGQKSSLVPCGINMPPDETDPRITNALLYLKENILEPNKKHVLFAGAFDNAVKDPELAKSVITIINGRLTAQLTEINIPSPVQLIELKGYIRDEVNALMYACDAILMTSKTEGSPQVIKEAMACGLPIVSVDVGDVRERLSDSMEDGKCNMENGLLDGCCVAKSREPKEIAELLEKVLAFGKRTEGRSLISKAGLTNDLVAKRLIEIYNKVLQ